MATATNTAKKTPTPIAWENDTHNINVQPAAQDNGVDGFTFLVQFGMTQPDGDGRPARRFKVFRNDIEVGKAVTNAKKAVEQAISTVAMDDTSTEDKIALFNVENAVEQIKAMISDDSAPKHTPWDEREDAKALKKAHTDGDKAAKALAKGGADVRKAMHTLSGVVADAKEALADDKDAWKGWLEAAPEELHKALNAGKNSVNEFLRVGRLPIEWLEANPESTTSAKSYERNFNNDKQTIANRAQRLAYKGLDTGDTPDVAAVNKAIQQALSEIAEGGQTVNGKPQTHSSAVLASMMNVNLSEQSDGYKVQMVALNDDGKFAPAYLNDGKTPVCVAQFSVQANRAHELVDSVCKEVNGAMPDALEARDEKEAARDRATVEEKAAKVFKDYTVSEAVLHLARILSGHPEGQGAILDGLDQIAADAEKRGWKDAIADYEAAHTEADNAAADDEAEASADDDA